ncbi:S-layer protein [Lactobacillus sp. LC28-10]|uniref:S-layer protein n=1 Tax=Secundilactobacillus angelensis TaxID=2722706 RepID=A0ABX1L0Y7_9LACO|nr:S-layer protein [Secundilactobacillus angelensis]MCH5461665.1 S-layer protein [Secundilactobacillus angelensis]NLR17961.1 S-layer protein [Secundilactobacillus angelensis]
MKSSLKKSLYVGLAAASVFGAAGLASTTASAKSYAYVTKALYFNTAPESRNVVPTGSNALYSKVGTSKGARVVASKTTMARLGNSNRSNDYFRAYSIVSTNRGSVYYKVVSFDGHYRGWIYGGKDKTKFGGGIASTNTTSSAALPSTTTGYTLTNPSKWTLWNNPKYTQYKASKVTGFSNTDTFTITGAETKTREGWVYYQVKDDQNPSITGWVYNLGVQAPQGNSVKISYVDKDTGKEVGTGSVPFDKSATYTNVTTTSNLNSIVNGVPSGYVPYDNNNGGSASLANKDNAAVAKNGDTLVYYVKAAATDTTKAIKVVLVDKDGNAINLKSNDQAALDAAGAKAAFQVKAGDTISAQDVQNILADANLTDLISNSGSSYRFASASNTPTTTNDNGATITVRATYNLIAY